MTKTEHAAALARCKELKPLIESHDILSNLPDKWAFRAVVDLPSALDMLERAMAVMAYVDTRNENFIFGRDEITALLCEWEAPDAE